MFEARPSGRGPRRQRCPEHVARRKRELIRARDAYNRAVGFGVVAELVVAREVFERDRWRCHICGRLVPKSVRGTRVLGAAYEPLAPVVDHVVPLSKGGPHTFVNCRTAHWTCNARKHTGTELSAPRYGEPPAPRPCKKSLSSVKAPTLSKNGLVIGRPRVNSCACRIDGCGRNSTTIGLCSVHYHRTRKYGDPLIVKCGCGCAVLSAVEPAFSGLFYLPGHGVRSNVRPPEVILQEGVVAQPVSDYGRQHFGLVDDCHVWRGRILHQGYGVVYLSVPGVKRRGRAMQTHRLAYELRHGEGSATGWTIDHLCGLALCCNANHLEAVTIAVNLARAAERVVECPRGHRYDEANTMYGLEGHRRCRQCNTDRYHLRVRGHEFVDDPSNPSAVRRRCLTCGRAKEGQVEYCPYGHAFTEVNTRVSNGKRACRQCTVDRDHVAKQGHVFEADPASPNPKKRRCLTCTLKKTPKTHCIRGHELTEANTTTTRGGQRNCLACALNARHVPMHGHDFVIDTDGPMKKRRCLTCRETAQLSPRTCVHGHLMTPGNTHTRARGGTECRTCIVERAKRKR